MNNKDYIRFLRRKMEVMGESVGEVETLEAREVFNNMIDEKLSPTVNTVFYVKREYCGDNTIGKNINVNVTDVSKNDQKSNDEKYFDFKLEENPKIGDQILWDETWWTLYHKENNSVITHRTFTAKKCNFDYHFEYRGKRFEFPISLVNLTLYSDGMADKVYMSNQDGKRKLIIPNNENSKNIKVGTRVMITNNTVFEITHVDDFSRPGVKDCIVSQVFRTSQDDTENNLAFNKDNLPIAEEDIIGEKILYLGSNEVYTTKIDKYSRWEVEAIDNCVYVDTSYGEGCRLICTDDIKYIGTKIKLKLIQYSTPIAIKEITIKGMF